MVDFDLLPVDASALRKARLFPLVDFCWIYEDHVHDAEIHAQRADATRVAIALARFHTRNGKWPQTLTELVPRLLPEVPLDRLDGRPIRYRVSASGPMLYSVWADRVDDGGAATIDLDGISPPLRRSPESGDWVLLPLDKLIW